MMGKNVNSIQTTTIDTVLTGLMDRVVFAIANQEEIQV